MVDPQTGPPYCCSVNCCERSRIACQTFVVSQSGSWLLEILHLSSQGRPRPIPVDGSDFGADRLPEGEILDVLACPSCARHFAVGRAGSLGGWRCAGCSNELRVVNRDVSRSSPHNVPPRPTADDHLRLLVP